MLGFVRDGRPTCRRGPLGPGPAASARARLTDDVDAALWAEGVEREQLLLALAAHGVRPRIDDALAFAERSQVLLLEHEATGLGGARDDRGYDATR